MKLMPILFVGHGNPMNALDDNIYTREWTKISKEIPKPKAILAISAHWYTKETRISTENKPRIIYDFYGFPDELNQFKYDVKGNKEIAEYIQSILPESIQIDNTWGVDHGVWSILHHMYKDADIPIITMSIASNKTPKEHYELGKALSVLRSEGILIFASGNIVHNLSKIEWNNKGGSTYAQAFDDYIKQNILFNEHDAILNYQDLGEIAKYAVPTPEHFYPLLYILGASNNNDQIRVFNDSCLLGSLSMTSYLLTVEL